MYTVLLGFLFIDGSIQITMDYIVVVIRCALKRYSAGGNAVLPDCRTARHVGNSNVTYRWLA